MYKNKDASSKNAQKQSNARRKTRSAGVFANTDAQIPIYQLTNGFPVSIMKIQGQKDHG